MGMDRRHQGNCNMDVVTNLKYEASLLCCHKLHNFSKRVKQPLFFIIRHKQIAYAGGEGEGRAKRTLKEKLLCAPF